MGELADAGSVLDLAPTVLALLGIPRAADMPGRACAALLEESARAAAALAPVPTYDTGFRAAREEQVPEEMRANYIQRYKQLGYIGVEDEKPR
jgi:arylsulfatase A-like enzyme